MRMMETRFFLSFERMHRLTKCPKNEAEHLQITTQVVDHPSRNPAVHYALRAGRVLTVGGLRIKYR